MIGAHFLGIKLNGLATKFVLKFAENTRKSSQPRQNKTKHHIDYKKKGFPKLQVS